MAGCHRGRGGLREESSEGWGVYVGRKTKYGSEGDYGNQGACARQTDIQRMFPNRLQKKQEGDMDWMDCMIKADK